MADTAKTPAQEAGEKTVAASEAEKAKAVEETAKRQAVRPTPTQRECDLAAVGAGVMEKEPDGSPPDLRDPITRALEAGHKPSSSYTTRDMSAGPGATRSHRASPPSSST